MPSFQDSVLTYALTQAFGLASSPFDLGKKNQKPSPERTAFKKSKIESSCSIVDVNKRAVNGL